MSSIPLPAWITAFATGAIKGTAESTRPAPSATLPASPIDSTQASTTCTMVENPATQLSPAIAAASATYCTSAARAKAHSEEAALKTSVKLTNSATATATVVYPPSSLKKAASKTGGRLPAERSPSLPNLNPAFIVALQPCGPQLLVHLSSQYDSNVILLHYHQRKRR